MVRRRFVAGRGPIQMRNGFAMRTSECGRGRHEGWSSTVEQESEQCQMGNDRESQWAPIPGGNDLLKHGGSQVVEHLKE